MVGCFLLVMGVFDSAAPTATPDPPATATPAEPTPTHTPTSTAVPTEAPEATENPESTEAPASTEAPEATEALCAGMDGTQAAQQLGHGGLVRNGTEPCTWGLNYGKEYTTTITLPEGWVGTIHRPGLTNAEVFIGEGQQLVVWGGLTARFKPGFEDAQNLSIQEWACQIWEAENRFGAGEVEPFVVELGNFSCGDNHPAEESRTAAQASPVECPQFGGYSTTLLEDGTSCKFEWRESRGSVTAAVPEGWFAVYWHGAEETIQTASAGEEIFTGEATFYRSVDAP